MCPDICLDLLFDLYSILAALAKDCNFVLEVAELTSLRSEVLALRARIMGLAASAATPAITTLQADLAPAAAQPPTSLEIVSPSSAATVITPPAPADLSPSVASTLPGQADHTPAAAEPQTQPHDLSSLVSPTASKQGGGHGLDTLATASVSSSITGQQPFAVQLAIASLPPFPPTAVKQGGGQVCRSSTRQSSSPCILPGRPHITSVMPWGSHPHQLVLWSQGHVTFDPGG